MTVQVNGRTIFNGSVINTPTITGGNVTDLTNLGASNATLTSANITQIETPVAADNTLSGTPIIITVYDVATDTPYYFKAYPTKP